MTRIDEKFEKSQIAQLPVSQWKALLALAYGGSLSAYQVAKRYDMKYPVVHRAIRSLRGLGWVKVTGRELTVKNVKTIIYGLTAEGVLWFLSRLPKGFPPYLLEELSKRDTSDCSHKDKTSEDEITEGAPEQIEDLVKQIVTQENVHMHLLLELDVDRIAEKNTRLFPAVFGPWEIHKRASMSESMASSLPELAFSTLTEYYYGYEDLLEKYGTIDQVFAYKVYKEIMENSASAVPDTSLEPDSKSVERMWEWMHDVSEAFPQVIALYKDIVLELENRFAKSLSFTREIAHRFASDHELG